MTHIAFVFALSTSAALGAYGLMVSVVVPERPPAAANPLVADTPDPERLEAYLGCSQEAQLRILSHSEVSDCLEKYLMLKLSFLPDIEQEKYTRLDAADRWAINQRGYAAYVAWRARAMPGG